jgi:hypothetical protein
MEKEGSQFVGYTCTHGNSVDGTQMENYIVQHVKVHRTENT